MTFTPEQVQWSVICVQVIFQVGKKIVEDKK